MGSEVLAHVAVGAVEMDGTGRTRKGSAKLTSHMRIMGTAVVVGEEAGAVRWTMQQNCWVITWGNCTAGGGGAGAPGRQLQESVCRNGTAALLVPAAVLKRRCALRDRLLSYLKTFIKLKLYGLGKQ